MTNRAPLRAVADLLAGVGGYEMGNVFTEPDLALVDELPRCCICGKTITGMPGVGIDYAYCAKAPNCKTTQLCLENATRNATIEAQGASTQQPEHRDGFTPEGVESEVD